MSNSEYLVRGATLICSNGSHKRKINLPKCHGVYVGVHPLLHELECLTEPSCGRENCNITSFGVCTSTSGTPQPTEIKTYIKTKQNSKDGKTGSVTGCKCMPAIIGVWRNTYPYTRIIDNGDKNSQDRELSSLMVGMPTGQSMITMESFLVCKYGGIIVPIDSGQRNLVCLDDFYNVADYLTVQRMVRDGNKLHEID